MITASSGDNLKLWKFEKGSAKFYGALSTTKTPGSCSPISSFDWNPVSMNIIGSASIDTTCTIWDIEAKKVCSAFPWICLVLVCRNLVVL